MKHVSVRCGLLSLVCGLIVLLCLVSAARADYWVVNLDAVNNGSSPPTSPGPVVLTLAPGSYTVTPIQGTYTAWNAWDGSVAGGAGWLNRYTVAYGLTKTLISDNGIYGTPGDAFLHALSYHFALSEPTQVLFSISDSVYSDNVGGMSLRVSAVPLPCSVLLLAPGLITLAASRRKFKK